MSWGRVKELSDQVLKLSRAVADRSGVPEVSVCEVDRDTVYSWVRGLPGDKDVKMVDNKYRLTSLDDYRRIIQWDRTNLRPYIYEFWDCDDYSMRFKSNVAAVFLVNGVGWVIDWWSAHAYNLLITCGGGVYIYEPQNDRIYTVEERDRDLYGMERYTLVV